MNNFIVPQFIDIEDRIFGPITIRQFLICTVGGLLVFAAFKLSDFSLFVFQAIFLVPITIVFAFVKVNGKNFHYFLLDLLIFLFKVPRMAVWQKKEFVFRKKIEDNRKKDTYFFEQKSLPRAKLNEISLIVDTGGAYIGEDDNNSNLINDI
ncbi:MAG TPA: PrgI family protein [bacterium]|nr:PrgI family protein [bacterium]